MASAVPQEPAPRTAIRLAGFLMRSPRRRLLGSCGRLLWAALDRLGVERIEVDGLQQQLREAALGHDVADRLARKRIERRGTKAPEQRAALLLRGPLHEKNAGLHDLDQEQRLLLVLRLERHGESHLDIPVADVAVGRADVEL